MDSCFLIAVFVFAFSLSNGERTLKFVTVLYRHGDRSPLDTYPTDPCKDSDWPQGFGQLSQEGKKQHYELGQFLKKRYSGFLSENYNRKEIYIRSVDLDRTLMSAEANLAGMFPPNSSEEFIPGLKWQPIPVHTVPEDKDLLLHFPLRNCPRYIQLMNETKNSDTFHKMTVTYKAFIEMVRKKTGKKTVSVDSVWTIYDTLFCESKHGKVLPDWVTTDVNETLKVLNDFSYQIMFGVYERKEKSRLQGGLLLDQIIKNISSAAASHNEQKTKMIVYSAVSHVMFSVEMFYRNDSAVEPYAVSLPNCSRRCPLQDFVALTRDVIPQDWNKECEIKKEATDTSKGKHNHGCTDTTFFSLILLLLVLLRTDTCNFIEFLIFKNIGQRNQKNVNQISWLSK
ncbi:hypothetical protein ABG768_005065 [Culter alburnus]|uniref:Lysosomal acid phosphatase n=1 Tax=Culter alburnus TaxID=194366 RepID=A0AAW1ZYA5_CULAL